MCIVIDMNVFPNVFYAKNPEHAEYVPVHRLITEGKGFMVMGGTHYMEELKAAGKYLALVAELSKKGRVKQLIASEVDKHEQKVKRILQGSHCDDCHLIAIVRASGCRLICSNDKRADKYLKSKKCYLAKQKIPNIYRKRIHRHLLTDENIPPISNSL